MPIHITVIRGGAIITDHIAADRGAADKLFADALTEHPDCEVKMIDGEYVLVSVGPRVTRDTPRN